MVTARIDPDRQTARVPQAATGREFWCSQPSHPAQFAAGFVAGAWYVEPVGKFCPRPESPPFPTLVAAIRSVNPPADGR